METESGHDLDTIAGARAWLVEPAHWHETRLYILRWEGLLPTVMRYHGERLVREPWDDGLAWAVVYERRLRRRKREAGEPVDESDPSGPLEG